jgi:hypothetical protein
VVLASEKYQSIDNHTALMRLGETLMKVSQECPSLERDRLLTLAAQNFKAAAQVKSKDSLDHYKILFNWANVLCTHVSEIPFFCLFFWFVCLFVSEMN